MKRWLLLILCLCILPSVVIGQQDRPLAQPASPRFTHVDIYLDAKSSSLAAYQLEFAAETGRATVVGIEGGEHPAFARTPPYYDPAAMGHDRVILAAFSTGKDLPTGKTRIARIHLMIEGDKPQYGLKLVVAADPAARTIPGAALSLTQGATP